MAVTRINNNQITDASAGNVYLGINANTKIQNYSITAGKIANNLSYGSDLTVVGNLTVQGNTTAIDTTITTIEDPVIVLASQQTGAPAVDIGFIGERGTANNIAFVWDESTQEFITAFTDTSETNTTINVIGYANIRTLNASVDGNLSVGGNVSITGNVASLNVTGNVTSGNLLTPGLVSATGTITSSANIIAANIETGGQVSATGIITGSNILTAGNVSATGNVTGNNLNTSGNISAGGTATLGNVATGGTVSAAGNITAGSGSYFLGDGSQLTGVVASSVNAGNLVGNTLSSNVIYSSLTTVGSLTSLSVVGSAQVGNLQTAGEVSATGNVTSGNVNTAGLVSATGNVTGGNVFTGGLISATGNLTASSLETSGTANVTGTITGGNISTGGFVSATGNATAGNVNTGGLISATGNAIAGNVNTGGLISATGNAIAGNITTAGLVSATGDVTGGNITTGGFVSATGNITGGNVNAPQVYGSTTLTLAAGTGNINLNTTGNIVLANTIINGVAQPIQDQDAATKLYVDTLATTGITIHPAVLATTNANLATATGGAISYTQPNGVSNGIGAYIQTTGTFTTIDTANVQTVGTRILVKNEANAVLNGVYTYSNATAIVRALDADQYGSDSSESFSLNDYFFTTGGNVNAGAAFVVDAPPGVITFGTSNISFAQFSSSQVYSANTAAGLSLVGTVFSAKIDDNTTAFDGNGNIIVKAGANLTTPNIGAATGTSLSTTGTVTGGNLETGGTVSATGTATLGNVATGGTVSATGTATLGNVNTGGAVSATGNIDGGNVNTGGLVSATGNVTGANLVTGGLVTSTGNVTGGNILTAGLVSSTGTVTGGNLATGGTVSATGTATLGNVNTGGEVSATGNITGANFITSGASGNISGTGNITAGNVLTGGIVSATGNVYGAYFIGNISGNIDAPGANTNILFNDNDIANATAGFTFDKTSNAVTVIGLITSGSSSAVGNINAGNVLTGGLISVTGNATAGNINTVGNIYAGNIVSDNSALVSGNLVANNVVSQSQFTGGNIVIQGDDITDNNGRVNFNSSQDDVDFAVNGDTVANVFYIDGGTGTASFGNATQTTNSVVAFNATNSIKMPVGNTAQRPAGATGQFRFNTTVNSLEVYDNSAWVSVGQPDFTLITDEQFNGDGSTTVFTLAGNATTAGSIVSINGVQQIPVTAYGVVNATLTFTEAPAAGDLIDVRVLVTTSSVYSISNTSGNAVVAVSDGSNVVAVTGSMSITGDLTVDGNAIITGNVVGDSINNGTTSIQIQTSGGNANVNVGGTGNLAVFAPGNLLMTGNISPTANAVYSLGTATNQWKDLYVSGNTVYIGGTSVATSAGALTVGGNPVVVAGGTTTGNMTVTGNISGSYILGNGSQLTGIDATSIQNGNSSVTVIASAGNVRANIAGATVTTTHAGGLNITGIMSATGNITGGNISLTGNTYPGNVITSGTVSIGNLTISANTISSSSQNITIGQTGNIGNIIIAGNLQVLGNTTTFNSNVVTTNDLTVNYANNAVNSAAANGGGIEVGPLGNPFITFLYNNTSNVWTSSGGISAVGNITGGNLSVGTGTITVGSIINANGNGVGNIGSASGTFNTIFAKATSAQYADLAEKYVADAEYAPGTVVAFGGTAEVTVDAVAGDTKVAGVVSTNPSYTMNAGLVGEHVATVALTGRVPTMVLGPVRKGDLMVAAGLGRAQSSVDPKVGSVIGKALEDFDGTEGTIEVVVGRF